MTREQVGLLQALQGRGVSLALRDGSCLEDAVLVSVSFDGAGTVWVFADGSDRFVPLPDVADVWEAAHSPDPVARTPAATRAWS